MMSRLPILALGLALACAPAPQQAAAPAAPPAPDTAAVQTALNALADQYEAAEVGGNAGQVAALYTDDGVTVFQGFPTAAGKAAIEAQTIEAMKVQKVLEMTIETGGVTVVGPTMATAGGTAIQLSQEGKKKTRMWWRWAGAYRNVAGQWKLSYLMAFQDSTKAAK